MLRIRHIDAKFVPVTYIRLQVVYVGISDNEHSLRRLNIFTIYYYQKEVSITTKTFKQNNVFLLKTSIQKVIEMT
jgi:hypothetical protein